MAEPGDPHSPHDGAPQGPNDDDLFRDAIPAATPQSQRPTWAAPVRPAPEAATESASDIAPDLDPHAHDDLIGFTSPASLAGTGRSAPEPVPEPMPAPIPAPEPARPEAVVTPFPQTEPLALAPGFDASPQIAQTASEPFLKPSPVPAWALETPVAARAAASPTGRNQTGFGRADTARAATAAPEGATGLYTIYALILFAVPTFGVAAMLGLLMVWARPKPEQPLASSHFEFQTRTLWIAAVAAIIGVVLIAVNLGVFVLFLMAVWVIVRGAWGVMTLAAGKPVRNPRTWLI